MISTPSTTGVCTCGGYGNVYDVVGRQGDLAPQQVCAAGARAWVTFRR